MGVAPGMKVKALTAEQKRQPGAYLLREGRILYRVVGMVGTGMLRVENAMTGNEISLTTGEVESARYVRGPESLDCPDYLPTA